MPFSGTVTRRRSYNRGISGDISFIGNIGTEIPQVIQKLAEGILSFAGGVSLKRRYKRNVEGYVTFVGNIGDGARFKRSISGVLTFAGDTTTLAYQRTLSGVIRFSGSVTRVINGVPIATGNVFSTTKRHLRRMIYQWRK